MKALTEIDQSDLSALPELQRGLRLTARHWPLCHSKLMSLRWHWCEVTPYGATDGRRLLLNRSGIEKLSRQPRAARLIAFLLVHEALHALLNHGARLSHLPNHDLANVAADYVINAMIAIRNREVIAAGETKRDVFALIDGILLDEQLSGDLNAIELYRKLDSGQPQPQPQPDEPDGAEQSEEDGAEQSEEDGAEQDVAEQDGAEQSEEDGAEQSEGEGEGEGEGDEQAGGDGAAAGDDLSDFVGTGAPDTLKPEAEGDETDEEVANEIEQSNDSVILQDSISRIVAGDKTGQTGKRIAEERRRSQAVCWTDLVRQWARGKTSFDNGSPFSQKLFTVTGLIANGRRATGCGEIVLVLDSSGSVSSATYTAFLQQAEEILQELRPDALHLMSVAHEVCDYAELQDGDQVPMSLNGGGGTLFQPAFDFVNERNIQPEMLIYLTDGYSSDLSALTAPEYPVLWVSTSLPARYYPFGEVVIVDNM